MDSLLNQKYPLSHTLCKCEPSYKLGYGLYQNQGQVSTSVPGILRKKNDTYFMENKLVKKCVGVQVGDIVYAEVTKIREQEAFVSIIQVNEHSLSKPIEATLKKQHVRQKMIDQVVMLDSYRPRDFIKAKVVSMGDSMRNLYLSTAHQDLGVMVAVNQKSERVMLPLDWETMVDVKSGEQQKRKVGKPQF